MKIKKSLKELTKWEDFEKKLLADPEVKKDLPYMEVEYQILKKLIDIRLKKNISQKELAKRLKTKQPAISRRPFSFVTRLGSHLEQRLLGRALRPAGTRLRLARCGAHDEPDDSQRAALLLVLGSHRQGRGRAGAAARRWLGRPLA